MVKKIKLLNKKTKKQTTTTNITFQFFITTAKLYIYMKGAFLSFENHTFSTNEANHGKVEAHCPSSPSPHF